jgi:hypothetical protein
LLALVPFVGMIVLIVWWCTKRSKGYNGLAPIRCRPNPAHGTGFARRYRKRHGAKRHRRNPINYLWLLSNQAIIGS